MKKSLKSIAAQLSESDIQELIRIKKLGDKKVVALQKKRDKLAADLARVEAELAKLSGEPVVKAGRRGRKPGPVAGKRKPRKGRRVNLTAAVREVFAQSSEPLRASQVVDALPGAGIKVANVSDMRKRISVVLASQKKSFEQVGRGIYRLRD